jgi:flagella basal body P-ring formation protein FlgA
MKSSLSFLRALAVIGLAATAAPAFAEGFVLKASALVQSDVVTLADLIDGVSGEVSKHAVFRAPAPGSTGTIQADRIIAAARNNGIDPIDTRGRGQVVVTRDARRVGNAEIDAALKATLEKRFGLDPTVTTIVLDGQSPALFVDPRIEVPLSIDDFAFDPRSRRFAAAISLEGAASGRAAMRVTGVAIEAIDVAVVNRAIPRGDVIKAADVTFERRARESAPADAIREMADLIGRIAKRPLASGAIVHTGDVAKPQIVARGDMVSVVYRTRGLILSLRAQAEEAGAMDDTITVTNPQSKRKLQATVIGPGQVAVMMGVPGPVAANYEPPQVRR